MNVTTSGDRIIITGATGSGDSYANRVELGEVLYSAGYVSRYSSSGSYVYELTNTAYRHIEIGNGSTATHVELNSTFIHWGGDVPANISQAPEFGGATRIENLRVMNAGHFYFGQKFTNGSATYYHSKAKFISRNGYANTGTIASKNHAIFFVNAGGSFYGWGGLAAPKNGSQVVSLGIDAATSYYELRGNTTFMNTAPIRDHSTNKVLSGGVFPKADGVTANGYTPKAYYSGLIEKLNMVGSNIGLSVPGASKNLKLHFKECVYGNSDSTAGDIWWRGQTTTNPVSFYNDDPVVVDSGEGKTEVTYKTFQVAENNAYERRTVELKYSGYATGLYPSVQIRDKNSGTTYADGTSMVSEQIQTNGTLGAAVTGSTYSWQNRIAGQIPLIRYKLPFNSTPGYVSVTQEYMGDYNHKVVAPFMQKQETSIVLGATKFSTTYTMIEDIYVAPGETRNSTLWTTISGYSSKFSVSWDTSITVTSGTLQEMYDYCHYLNAQLSNIQQNLILETADGANITLNDDYTVINGQNLDLSTQRLSGGTIRYGATGTYSPKLGAITIDFAQAGSYDLAGADISGAIELTNSSGGAVTVNLASGVSYTNTGPSITVTQDVAYQGLSFSGLVAGSQVYIFETGTQTVVDYVESSGTTFEWSEEYSADQTVDYTIINEGYTPIRVTGVALSDSIVGVTVQQATDRAYVGSSGLTYGTNASYNTSTEKFTLSTDSTLQNYYSFMVESWRDESTLKNVAFPFVPNGSASFTLIDGVEFDNATSIAHLSRDGLRYTDGGTCTACWSAILTSGVPTGVQAKYQQQGGSGTTNAANTGNIDQLIQVMGDASHGNFDYSDHLVLKVQEDGYNQAESDVVATYGTLADELYVVGLAPIPNGIDTGDPSLANAPTITDHAGSPVTWNGKDYSITITDSATGNTGAEIMQWLRYNFSQGGTFQSKDAFNWHDLVQENGEKFKTVRGAIYGDTGATLKGVRVVQNDGSTLHTDFDTFTADDGTTWTAPVYQTCRVAGAVAGTRIQIYDENTSTELYNGTPTFPYTYTHPTAYSADIAFRVRSMYQSGTNAKIFTQNSVGTATEASPDVSFNLEQTTDDVYETNAIDGSTVTGVSIDDTNLLVNVSTGTMTWQNIYAYEKYWLGTEEGIRDEGRAIVAKDTANYTFYSFDIKNVTSPTTPLIITGGYAVDSGTGASIDLLDTTGGTIVLAPDHVAEKIITVSGVNVITGDIGDLNDVSVSDVVTGMQAVSDDFKADVTGVATEAKQDDLTAQLTGAVNVIVDDASDNKDAVIAEVQSQPAPTAEEIADEVGTRQRITSKGDLILPE